MENINNDENVHRFAFSRLRGKLLGREKESKREIIKREKEKRREKQRERR